MTAAAGEGGEFGGGSYAEDCSLILRGVSRVVVCTLGDHTRVSLTDWRHVSKKKHRHITFCPNWPKRMPNERSHQELSHDVLKNKIRTFLNELWPKTRCQYFDPFGDPPQKNLTIWRTSFRLVNLVPH